MFRKLLSNLPFNPSLINQVSFYAKRVHQEESIRRSGMVLVVLAMLMQVFAVVAPPQASLAESGNDLIRGGFTKQSTAVEHCARNTEGFATILDNYQISCDNLSKAAPVSIKSTDQKGKLLSMGRWQYGKTGERQVTIAGKAYYLRPLWSWDSAGASTYQALKGTSKTGQPFWILYDCGNLVVLDTQAPVVTTVAAKKPKVEITSKTTLPGTPVAGAVVRPGDTLGYRIFFRNSGDGAATNVFVEDSTPSDTSFIAGSQGSGAANRYAYIDSVYPGHAQEPHVYWVYNSMPAGATGYYVDFKVKVNTGMNEGDVICNTAFIRSNETAQSQSNKICHTVTVKTNAKPATTTAPTATPTITIVPPATKPCAKSQDVNDVKSCLELHKSAINYTKGGINADNTTASAGDTIVYTLTTKNNANVAMNNHVIEENLGDVMEYAESVTDFNGGSMDANKVVRWPAVTIQPGQTVTKKLTVKIKGEIPHTPSPPGNPGSFDLLLTNTYGDTVNIRLPGSVATIVARANTTLPNTGPGTTVTIAVLFAAVSAYFFYRSRLMGKELDIVREDYAAAGGV